MFKFNNKDIRRTSLITLNRYVDQDQDIFQDEDKFKKLIFTQEKQIHPGVQYCQINLPLDFNCHLSLLLVEQNSSKSFFEKNHFH